MVVSGTSALDLSSLGWSLIMGASQEEIEVWQRRIEAAFKGPDGLVGQRVLHLTDLQNRHCEDVIAHTRGFKVLMDAFQDFALQTIDEAQCHEPPPGPMRYAFFVATLRRFIAALHLLFPGYYLDGASLLRAVWENTLYIAAGVHGLIPFSPSFGGLEGVSVKDMSVRTAEKLRKKHRDEVERVIRDKMLGSESGLSAEDQEVLFSVTWCQHGHVHRAESSFLMMVCEMHESREWASVAPRFDLNKTLIFVNTAAYIGWMLLRTLPFVSRKSLFSSEWLTRYEVLDTSFRFWLTSLESEIGPTMVRFIDAKFSFADQQTNAGYPGNTSSDSANHKEHAV
jgi:hypothetical protein